MKTSQFIPMSRKITSGTKEWADHNVNCIKGCFNNCRYCYAKTMARRFGRCTDGNWKHMKIREDVLRKDFRKWQGRVMFPSSHDIFSISPFKEACFTVLQRLLESGNEVLIATKPRLAVVQEMDQQFNHYQEQMQFRFTITSVEDKLLEFWEPNAPRYKERLASLEFAFRRGFRTSVSVEPFLDYDPAELIENVMPFTTESIWIGRMNYIPRRIASERGREYYERIRRNYETPHLWKLYGELEGISLIRFKDSMRIQLGLETEN